MIALGIDGALSKPIAIASLSDVGRVRTRKVPVPRTNGAQRLATIRSAVAVVLSQIGDVAVVVVETPFGRQSVGLTNSLQAQGVLLEAAQATHPGATVLDLSPGEWKKHSVGIATASKVEYIRHAKGMGLDSDDEDECAALCMAQAGMELFLTEMRAA